MYATRTRAFRANPAGYPLAEPRAYRVNGLGCECPRAVTRVAPDQLRTMSGPAGVRAVRRGRLGGSEGNDEWSFIDTIPYVPAPIFNSPSSEVTITNYGSTPYPGQYGPAPLAPAIPGLLPVIPGVSAPISGGSSGSSLAQWLAPLANIGSSLIKAVSGGSRAPQGSGAPAALQSVIQSPVGTVAGPQGVSSSALLYGGLGVIAFALISGRKR